MVERGVVIHDTFTPVLPPVSPATKVVISNAPPLIKKESLGCGAEAHLVPSCPEKSGARPMRSRPTAGGGPPQPARSGNTAGGEPYQPTRSEVAASAEAPQPTRSEAAVGERAGGFPRCLFGKHR